tara:strand:+ start:266759 stop:268960 length:2202 start_codon:yes stop_codon:yes gene_type:complete
VKKFLFLILSVLLVVFGFSFVDFNDFYSSLMAFPLRIVLPVFSLFLLNTFVVVFRYWRVLQHFGYTINFSDVVRASVSGNIASLIMIPLVGQVAGRQVMLSKAGISAAENAAIAAYERFVVGSLSGLLALVGGLIIFSPIVNEYFRKVPILEMCLIAVFSLVVYLCFFVGRVERRMLEKILSFKSLFNALEVYLVTLLSSVVVLLAFYLLFASVIPESDFLHVLSAAAIVSFLAGLPVSFGGWGLREISSMYVLSFLGGSSASALAASVLLGFTSIAAVLVLFPLLFVRPKVSETVLGGQLSNGMGTVSIEDVAIWILTLMVGLLVLFQVHVQVGTGYLNVNLADPFAILIFSIVVLNVVLKRELPRWGVPKFNLYLSLITLAFVFSYISGVYSFGATNWASGKIIGWLVLLGYLFSGYLVVNNFGRVGFFKLSQLMLIAITVVLFVNILMWVLFVNGFIVLDNFHYILEAYSGNRNALAFQVLVVVCLVLAFEPWYARLPLSSSQSGLLSVALSIMIGAVLITGSRSAIGTLFVVLVVAFLLRASRPMFLLKSTFFGGVVFILSQYGVYLFGILIETLLSLFSLLFSATSATSVTPLVVLPISSESSDSARWALIVESFTMWRENPLFGAGLGAFFNKSVDLIGFSVVVHNTSLWLLAEFGLIGFIVFLSPFVLILKYAISICSNRVISNALILLLLMFALMSVFHEVFYQRMFWLALGGLIALPHVRKGLA